MESALVVIDVQESFRQRPNWRATNRPDIAERVERLVAAARGRGELVVWVLHAEPDTGDVFDPALGFVRLMDGLKPDAGEPVLTKSSHNAFTTTNLQQLLTARGIRAVTICGIRTEQCCETTARVASDFGHEVTFVIDATATTPIELPGRRTLGVDEIVERTEYVLDGRFATVKTVEELTRS